MSSKSSREEFSIDDVEENEGKHVEIEEEKLED